MGSNEKTWMCTALAVTLTFSAFEAYAAEAKLSLTPAAGDPVEGRAYLRSGLESRPLLQSTGREGLASLATEVQPSGLVVAYAPVPEGLEEDEFAVEALLWVPSVATGDASSERGARYTWQRIGMTRHEKGAATVSVSRLEPDRAPGTVLTALYKRASKEAEAHVTTTRAVDIPRGARLDLAYVVDELDARNMTPLSLRVTALLVKGEGDAERKELFRREIVDPSDSTSWNDVSLDLAEVDGKRVAFEFRTEPTSTDGRLVPHLAWAVPQLVHKQRGLGPPSVVLVSVDGLRARSTGCCAPSGSTTPFLDGFFGRDGVTFRRALAESVSSIPSHASLLTGASSCRHGLRGPNRRLGATLPTIAERFSTADYDTAAFVDSAPLIAELGFVRGFDRYVESDATAGEEKVPGPFGSALGWLAARGTKPFFLFVHRTLRPGDSSPAAYGEAARRIDAELREFLLRLDQTVDPDRLIVAVTSGHGEELGEHGVVGHGTHLFEESVRVPFLVRGGGAKPGSSPTALFGSMDVGPTLLELAGLAKPIDVEGVSRAQELRRGVSWGTELRFLEAVGSRRVAIDGQILPWTPPGYAAIEGPLKLIRDGVSSRFLAFDVLADPAELQDVAAVEPRPDWTERLRAAIEAHAETCESSRDGAASVLMLSPRSREALVNLGYVY